jgi:uncharacterized protein DUF3850
VKTHSLKTWPAFFDDMLSGKKSFEVRRNDRDFHEGDMLLLEEWIPDQDGTSGAYGERKASFVVTYVLRGPILGIKEGWVVMGTRFL